MPRYDKYMLKHMDDPVKMVLMGDSGTGKTGALASLANAGWNLRVVDLDNGIKILRQYLTDEGAQRIYYRTLTDRLKPHQGYIIPASPPTAFPKAIRLFDEWTDDEDPDLDLGPIESWGHNDIAVVDSLTMLSMACMRYVVYYNASNMKEGGMSAKALDRYAHPYQRDYGEAQEKLESFFALLYETEIKCNVIVTAHVRFIGGGGRQTVTDKETGESFVREVDSALEGKGYPLTVGRQLSPKIGRYFNTVLMTKVIGSGLSAKRVITTVPEDNIALKSEAPDDLEDQYEINRGDPHSGLARIFEILKGGPKENE